MAEKQRTTTSPDKPPLFEPPDLHIDEAVLAAHVGAEINPENYSRLLSAGFLTALVARDRRLTRDFFEEVVALVLKFQNRLVRISELGILLDRLDAGETITRSDIQQAMDHHKAAGAAWQAKIVSCLQLFREMRNPEDPVS